MKPAETCRIFIVFSMLSVSSPAIFQPPEPEDPAKDDSGNPDAPWHSDWAEVVGCKKGETQSRFPDCWCGQYAKIVREDEVSLEELEGESEWYYSKFRKNKKIYYICLPCSSCPDGVLMTGKCRQDKDTACNLDRCVNPNHFFDHGKKACVPNPTEPPDILEQTKDSSSDILKKSTNRLDEDNYFTSHHTVTDEPRRDELLQERLWYQHPVVIILVAFLVAFVVINILFVTFHRKRIRYRTMSRVPSNLSTSTQTGCTCMHETFV
ncbi:uncharacterized protein LOC121409113 [Lytechinus variegatus]|uniref:uncharacterized protein LOC121409113 n=1 Tax=Lytechinus variegatus TaxID=7654 RepID=UPI001BB23DE2|nr:uncharacterized protein LOC121409113 [Lytechinus variegatus]